MRYTLQENQSYDTTELQKELTAAGIEASVSGYGDKSFTVHTDDAGVGAVVQAHIVGGYLLKKAKRLKREELKAKALSQIQLVFPAINDIDELKLVREQWLSTAPAARQATTDFQQMIDIYQAAVKAISSINALNTTTEIEAYDVVNDPAWPV